MSAVQLEQVVDLVNSQKDDLKQIATTRKKEFSTYTGKAGQLLVERRERSRVRLHRW